MAVDAFNRQPAISMVCDRTGEPCPINTSGYNCAVAGPNVADMYEFPTGKAPQTIIRCVQEAVDKIAGAAHDRGYELGLEQGRLEAAQGGVQ